MNRELTVAPHRVAWLVQLLNVSDGANRVAELLRCCQQLESLRYKGPPGVAYLESPEGIAHEVRKDRLLTTANDLLSNYRFRPSVSVDYQLSVGWLPIDSKVSEAQIDAWRSSGLQLDKAPIPETAGIQIVLELVGSGLLNRIRQCAAPNAEHANGLCGKWFFAARNKKVVCSDACRSRKYQAETQFKEDRAKYMQRHRKTLRENKNVRVKKRQAKRPTT